MRVDAQSGQPVGSGPGGPGRGAHRARIAATTAPDRIVLTPDRTLLRSPRTVYPVYLDPGWVPISPARGAWASVSEYYPSTNYYNNTPDPQGKMQVGNSGSMWSHTLVNFPISSVLQGATIQSAKLSMTDIWSYSCTASSVNIYSPATTLTSGNATWNYWAGVNVGGVTASKIFAHGHSSGCPAAAETFDVTSGVVAAVKALRGTQTFLVTGTNEANDVLSWKEFEPSTVSLTITYDHPPNAPGALSTSPSTSCTAATPTTVGDGPVSLSASVSDREGTALTASFSLWKTSDTTATQLWPTSTAGLNAASGATVVTVVPAAVLEAAASTPTQFSWHVAASDGTFTGPASTTCSFVFDATRPAAPTLDPPGGPVGQIGQPTSFTVTPPVTGNLPSAYVYQLNATAPVRITADASGRAGITVRPTRMTNTLTVTSLSAGGNVGAQAAVVFTSAAAAVRGPADLTGDGLPDLLTPGGQNGLPPGLWQASGRTLTSSTVTGQVDQAPANIGLNGNGVKLDYSPTDFSRAQAISGHFTGTGLQDVLLYYPNGYAGDTDTSNSGTVVILPGQGDGSALSGIPDDSTRVPPGVLTDDNGDNPLQLADAGNTAGQNLAYPDLIGVSGDGVAGHYLTYYPNGDGVGSYAQVDHLQTAPPVAGTDWAAWTIVTTQLSTGTAMFLWNSGTGALYLWEGLTHTPGSTALGYTPYQLADGTTQSWNAGRTLTLQAGDLNADGTPDLWTVGPDATVTAWTVGGLSAGSGQVTMSPGQPLLTGNHAWSLADRPAAADNDPVTTTGDAVGALPLTGNGAVWNRSDPTHPLDVRLGSGSYLTTAGKAVDSNGDFSVSIWTKPSANGGTVIAENGSHLAALRIWSNAADASWRFSMTTSDAFGAGTDTAAAPAGSARPGVWTRLTATYRRTGGVMHLFVNDADTATAVHTTTWTPAAGNTLTIGADLQATSASASALNATYSGEVTLAQTWAGQTVDPTNTSLVQPPSGQWTMDDAALNDPATGVARDTTGLHDATLSGGAGWTTPGHLRGDPGALSLNGTTAAATTAGPVVTTSQSFTVSAWVKLAAAGTAHQLAVSQQGTYTHAFRLGYNGNNDSWMFRTVPTDATNAGGSTLGTAAGTAITNRWTFLAGVWNTTNSTMSFYVDGVLVSSAVVGTPFSATGPLTIGRDWVNSAYADYLNGQVDDVRAYQAALSPPDIATLAAATPNNSVFHLDESTGTTAHDAAGLHDAGLSAGAGWAASGHRSGDPGALTLDGTGAATTTGPVLDTGRSFTVTAWARLSATGGTALQAVVSQRGTATQAFLLTYYGGDNTWRFRTVASDTATAGGSSLTSPGAVAGRWTFLTGVFKVNSDGTTGMYLYVDGVLASQATGGTWTPFTANGELTIGRVWAANAYGNYFNGQIDEVHTYQSALSADDIRSLYANG